MLSGTCTMLSALKIILFIVYPPPNQNATSMRAGTWPVSFTAVPPASRMDRYLLVERRGRNSGGKNPTVPVGSLTFSTVVRKRLFCRHMMLSLLSATGISEDDTQRTIRWQMCNSLLCGDIPDTEVCVCWQSRCSPNCLKGQHSCAGHVACSEEWAGLSPHRIDSHWLKALQQTRNVLYRRDSPTFPYNGRRLKNLSILEIRHLDSTLTQIWVTVTT